MPTGFIPTLPLLTFTDSDGNPAAGYKLTTFAAGTTSAQHTWKNYDLTVLNPNPITLDAMGQCVVWFNDQSYKFTLSTPGGAVVWSQDNVAGAWPSSESLNIPDALTSSEHHNGPLISSNGPIHWVEGPFMFRNQIFNGDFSVNQRCVSTTSNVVLIPGQYGHDRWKAGSSGCTYSSTIVNGKNTITIITGTLQQIIEAPNAFGGYAGFVLTWVGTAQGHVDAGPYGASGIFGDLVGGNNVLVEFSTGTLTNVQLEMAAWNYSQDMPLNSPFEDRPFSFELQLCQRYYEKSYDYNVKPGTASYAGCFPIRGFVSSQIIFDMAVKFSVNKATTPTVTWYSPANGVINSLYNTTTPGNIPILTTPVTVCPPSQTSTGCILISATVSPTVPCLLIGHWVADAEI